MEYYVLQYCQSFCVLNSGLCCRGTSDGALCSMLQIAVKAGLPIMLPSWVEHVWNTTTTTDEVFHATDDHMVRAGRMNGSGR